ncbi:ppt1 [Symbiodinium natans]|uniref:Serine/threonine-protein phosphatase n=1 Tax=Symbiodinium natans TaxID=878477 RepID=A0A812GE47_9DINO|nr:ppt1 [Symbiodinium natans]
MPPCPEQLWMCSHHLRREGSDPRLVVVGDTHGQLQDVLHILEENGPPSEEVAYLFNGDIVDRGRHAVEIWMLIIAYKLAFPRSVFVLRGNHENDQMIARPFKMGGGFSEECLSKYNHAVLAAFQRMFKRLPLFAVVAREIFVVHGGLFRSPGVTLQSLRELPEGDWQRNYPNPLKKDEIDRGQAWTRNEEILFDALWADPHLGSGSKRRLPRKKLQIKLPCPLAFGLRRPFTVPLQRKNVGNAPAQQTFDIADIGEGLRIEAMSQERCETERLKEMAKLYLDGFGGKRFCLCCRNTEVETVSGVRSAYTRFPESKLKACGVAVDASGKELGLIQLGFHDTPGDWEIPSCCVCMNATVKADECHVERIVVGAAARGKGLGTKLLNWAEDRARERGCKTMFLEVVSGNPAKKLYEKHGYVTATSNFGRCMMCPLTFCVLGHVYADTMRKPLS